MAHHPFAADTTGLRIALPANLPADAAAVVLVATPEQPLLQARLVLAAAVASGVLAATDPPVSEIAPRVGYREASQFTKAFNRTHSATPSHFRKARRSSPRSR